MAKGTSDDRDVELKSSVLAGKKICLIVTGGIACIETPRIARELRRYGALVQAVMTPGAQTFITPLSLEWATKQPVITDLTGSAEHIVNADAILVAPATLDFITRVSLGLADSAAATLFQSALSRIPIFVSPSMHESLERNPIFQERLENLKNRKLVYVLEPRKEEGKSKLPLVEELALSVAHNVSESRLGGVRILLTLGPTRAWMDDVRFLSNFSTGRLGVQIAQSLFARGAHVHAVHGPLQFPLPSVIDSVAVQTNQEMTKECQKILSKNKVKAAIFAAAVLDFDIEKPSKKKTSSKESPILQLKPAPKLIEKFSSQKAITKIGFKLESRISEKDLISKARESLKKYSASAVIANRLEDVAESHRAFLVTQKSVQELQGVNEIAEAIAQFLEANP